MKNEYEIRGDTTVIFIESKKYGRIQTIISTADLLKVQEYGGTWCVRWDKGVRSFYVVGNLFICGKRKTILLHRWVMGVEDRKTQVDHVLHDTLDNCNWSLNTVNQSENNQNARLTIVEKSGHVGITYLEKQNKWRARIKTKGKTIYLGNFDTKEKAVFAREEAEYQYFGYRRRLQQTREVAS